VIDRGLRRERRAVLRKSVRQRGGLAGEKLVFQTFAFNGGAFWFHTGLRRRCRAAFRGSLAPDGGCQVRSKKQISMLPLVRDSDGGKRSTTRFLLSWGMWV
jgi:hypothetical protein